MDRKQVKELLSRYYSGDSTDSEEQLLRYYFISGTVPDEFKADQELFRTLHEEKSNVPSDFSFDKLIEESIKSDPSYIPVRKNPFYKTSVFRIAAGLAILTACATILYFTVYPGLKSKHGADTYSDPALAYAEAKKALQYVSVNLNHGTEKLQKLETFNEGMEKMNTLSIINLLQRN
jgi:hypothetical protein